jgi:putative FmdB family regulatory protein
MPLYDYDCAACGRRFEVVHGVHAEGPAACPLCGRGPVRKAITAAAVHYKGSGWAKKERRSPTRSNASAGADSSSDPGGGKDAGTGGTGDEVKATTPADSPGTGAAKEAATPASTSD